MDVEKFGSGLPDDDTATTFRGDDLPACCPVDVVDDLPLERLGVGDLNIEVARDTGQAGLPGLLPDTSLDNTAIELRALGPEPGGDRF